MGRWVETATYWQGDLLHFERRPFKGWCVEGRRDVGGTIRVVRIVADPAQRFAGGDWDFDFLRVFVVTALIMSTFLVMVALTPKPKSLLTIEEPIHDPKLRHAILAGTGDDAWTARGAPAPKLTTISSVIPGPTRIVIPTPPGSRVRRDEPDLIRSAGILALIRSPAPEELSSIFSDDTAAIYGVGGLGIRSDNVLGMLEGGVEGGVVGGIIGYGGGEEVEGAVAVAWGTIGTSADERCAPLVDHLVTRIFEAESQRAFTRRMCARASTQALDCLERAMSGDSIAAAGIVAQCGPDLPPPLTRRLQRLHR
jgi:hypothetical protein